MTPTFRRRLAGDRRPAATVVSVMTDGAPPDRRGPYGSCQSFIVALGGSS
ncbi:hypothetical protein [Streptomyces sp. NPDC005385]